MNNKEKVKATVVPVGYGAAIIVGKQLVFGAPPDLSMPFNDLYSLLGGYSVKQIRFRFRPDEWAIGTARLKEGGAVQFYLGMEKGILYPAYIIAANLPLTNGEQRREEDDRDWRKGNWWNKSSIDSEGEEKREAVEAVFASGGGEL